MIDRCASRVLSSAHRCARSFVAGDDLRQLRRMLEEVDQRPAQRGHQVGHRRDVDQRDVERDAANPDVARLGCQASTILPNRA